MTPPTPYELVMYSRTLGCPFITIARRVLTEQNTACREIMIDRDPLARAQVVAWTGFESVPTLAAVLWDTLELHSLPLPIEAGSSPRGIPRGSLITEPYADELEAWLRQNGFLA